MSDAEKFATIVRSIEAAARHMHTILLDSDVEHSKAAHDALNALTAARANAELLTLTEGATS